MLVKALGAAPATTQATRSFSLLIDNSTLIDCGPEVGTLAPSKLVQISSVLLSHSHVERCGFLPALANAHATHHGTGVTIYALQQTLDTLRQHMFNETASPAYITMTTDSGTPLIRLQTVDVGDALPLPGGLVTPLPAQHIIPALGWLIEGEWRSLGVTGDSSPCPAFWHWASNDPSLTDIVCTVRYSCAKTETAQQSGHLSPTLLQPFLALLPPNSQIWLNHMEIGDEDIIRAEVSALLPPELRVEALNSASIIEL